MRMAYATLHVPCSWLRWQLLPFVAELLMFDMGERCRKWCGQLQLLKAAALWQEPVGLHAVIGGFGSTLLTADGEKWVLQ